ncbi:MAG TPA: CVNH domain-containing protein [Candidatus Angelobacter sp.]|nr:CVNH domain-containing protein [Candidatus Angelobacter sp.]
MRGLMLSWAIALVCIAVQGFGRAQSIPSGSYQQSCKNVSVRDQVLLANCQDSDGKWEATQLRDYQSCGSDIMNDNGALRCGGNRPVSGYQPGYQAGVPNGSYTGSCQEIRIDGDDLKARCQGSDGNWHGTKLDDYQKCRGDVVNDNGKLRCVTGAYAPGYTGAYRGAYQGAPIGTPYTQTCKDIRSHGDDLEARCKNVNGDWQNTKLDDYRKCHGQIVNQDGALRCVAAPLGISGVPTNAPGGSYTASCSNVQVKGDDLEGECQTRGGDTRHAKLDDYQKCRSDIINDDGHLRCSK